MIAHPAGHNASQRVVSGIEQMGPQGLIQSSWIDVGVVVGELMKHGIHCSDGFKGLASPALLALVACRIQTDVLAQFKPFEVTHACRTNYINIFFSHIYFPASCQAVVTGVVASPSRFLHLILTVQRVLQSHCSSIFHRVLLTHALALSASQFVRKKMSPPIYMSIHWG